MFRMRKVSPVVVVICVPLLSSIAFAEPNRAAARVEAMAGVLAKAPRFSVTIDSAYDVVQPSGQKIEFGERRLLTVRRPDRARVEVTGRDGTRRGVIFDGKQVVTFDLDEKVYATVPSAGTVDAAIDHFVKDLRMRLPLGELLKTDLPQLLASALGSAQLVAEERVGGAMTDHVALRGDTTDVEFWIPREGEPLPERIVITYRLAEGQPQFQADFESWNLAPDVPDTLFTFTPAAGAERIPVLAPRERKKP